MLDPQNFSIEAGDDITITLDIDPDNGITLLGSTIQWRVYEQEFGQPTADANPVISKDNGVGGTVTIIDPDTATLEIPLTSADSISLLRNYYHEATVVDPTRGRITIAMGIMTVLGTENRS